MTRAAMDKRMLAATVLLTLSACGGTGEPGRGQAPATDQSTLPPSDIVEADGAGTDVNDESSELRDMPSPGELLPMPLRAIWQPWHGDWGGMVERRLIRAVVPFGGYQFYYEAGVPRGATWELLQRFEQHINETLGRRHVKVYVVAIPVNRDALIPALLDGHADLIAADLTMTAERGERLHFSRPLLTNVNEVVVMGKDAAPIEILDDLAGRDVVVRESSSYHEHLLTLQKDFTDRGLQPPTIRTADEILEAEDLLDMLNAGIIDITVLDDYKANFWATVFPDIVIRDDLVINEGGAIGWAMRQDTPQFALAVRGFMQRYGKGTLVGNDTYNRYLAEAAKVRCVQRRKPSARIAELAALFQKYGAEFSFDWLMLAAQGYQESGLRQNLKSPAGAIGVMQIKPSTAAGRNVGIENVTDVDNNIHAAAKYMRFLADRYFGNDEIDDLNQWLLALGAYNAGPAKINRYRQEAEANGYDPNRWFDHVEIIAARRIGRETVTYVSNVFKYYVGYQLTLQRLDMREDRHGETLKSCWADDA
jgi:membrane-bound lytic murein transglycosylase MltF